MGRVANRIGNQISLNGFSEVLPVVRLLFLFCWAGCTACPAAQEPAVNAGSGAGNGEKLPAQAANAPGWAGLKPIVVQAHGFAETPNLHEIAAGLPALAPSEEGQFRRIPIRYFRRSPRAAGPVVGRDPVIQSFAPTLNIPSPSLTFAGVTNSCSCTPPDTNGDVGPSNYVQSVNVHFQVYNKFTGAAQTPIIPINALFAGLGNPCETTNDGDPVVLYDPLADRWLISQFANAFSTAGPYYMSIAISKTADPTGAYYVYCFQMPGSKFNDYPKFGVWPDAYYMTDNQFNSTGTTFLGAGVFAFDRAKMLMGDPTASYIYFDLEPLDATIGGLLPSDLDGPPPPIGTPNYFAYFTADEFGDPADGLRLFQFHADFASTNLSTFVERPESRISVAAFNPNVSAVDQPATGQNLDTLADRLMHRLQYRNFSSNESLVVTHTVVGGSSQAAIRYYQLRRTLPGGSFVVNEQATFAPDTDNRWMGSAAMDYQGTLAVGYSVSGSSTFPSIRYAARLASDPPGGLSQGEGTIQAGGGSQTDMGNRWGDYSALSVDPDDDCSFWYTTEYYSTTSAIDWNTRIGKFSLAGCTPAPRGTIRGTVTSSGSGLPIPNVVVRTTSGFFRVTDAAGAYSMTVPPGTYDMSAFATGRGTITSNGVSVANGGTTIQNFVFPPLPPIIVTNGAAITAESCSAANVAIDPDEMVTVSFSLKNIGDTSTTNLVATLQAAGGVTSPSGPQNYGILPAGGSSLSRPFTFTANGTCGGTLAAVLQLQDGAANLGLVTNFFKLGALGPAITNNYSSGGLTTAIPDVSTIEVPITITDAGVVTDVNVRVRLDHTFDGDLFITLVHPDNTAVNLANKRGSSGANYGSGATSCAGTFTVFDDAAATAISAGAAPFAGSFRPEQPLSTLNGKPTQGTWKLRITDTAAVDTGTLYCWQLQIGLQPPVCCTGPVNFPPVVTAATVVPGASAFSDESLAVTNVVASDFESEAITIAYQWQFTTNAVAFIDQGVATSASLPEAPANSGKLWRCRITPSDPSGTGTNFFTATVAVNNRPNMLGRHGQLYSYDSDLFLVGAAAGPVFPRNAIINEFSQGTSGTKEWVELLFLNNCDARGWTLADSNTGTNTFQNTALWSNVTAGTLLVVYNAGDRDTVLPPDDSDPSDGTLLLPHTNAAFSATAWIGLSNGGDAIALRDSSATLIDGVSYGNNSSQTPQLGSVSANTSASYTNNTEAGAESAANWQIIAATSATPVAGNGTVNSNFVASLRAGISIGVMPLFRFAAGSDSVPGLSINATNGLVNGTINAPGGGFFNFIIERFAGTNVVSQQYNLLVGDSNNVYTIPAMKTWAMNTNYTIGGTLVVNGTLDTRGYTLVVSNTIDVTGGTVSNATGLIRYHKLIGGPLPGNSQQFNSLPSISTASISPASPNTTQDLLANVTGSNDADNDTITFGYQWQDSTNNASFADIAFAASTLPASATVAGKYYRVVITPNDGIGNGAPFTTASVLVPADSDADGMNDDWEVAHFGSLAQTANDDFDGDGFSNLAEFTADTDPSDAQSLPQITAIEPVGGDVLVSFTTSTNKFYNVEHNIDLLAGSWTTVTNNVAGTGGIVQITDPGAGGDAIWFYRVKVLP